MAESRLLPGRERLGSSRPKVGAGSQRLGAGRRADCPWFLVGSAAVQRIAAGSYGTTVGRTKTGGVSGYLPGFRMGYPAAERSPGAP